MALVVGKTGALPGATQHAPRPPRQLPLRERTGRIECMQRQYKHRRAQIAVRVTVERVQQRQ
jgi:hypothetical protein